MNIFNSFYVFAQSKIGNFIKNELLIFSIKSGGNFMDKSNGVLIGCLVALAVLNLVGFFVLGSHNIDQQALADKVTAQVISQIPDVEPVPTAAEIAALITVPAAPIAPEVTIPEFKENEKVNDLWENLYAVNISKLETEAYDVAVIELKDRDYRLLTKWLESNVVGFDELDTPVEIHDFEVTVVELGLDEKEDKVATVEFELKVRYSLLEGTDEDFKKTVKGTATVTFDEGEFDDEDVELVFV